MEKHVAHFGSKSGNFIVGPNVTQNVSIAGTNPFWGTWIRFGHPLLLGRSHTSICHISPKTRHNWTKNEYVAHLTALYNALLEPVL